MMKVSSYSKLKITFYKVKNRGNIVIENNYLSNVYVVYMKK